MQNPIDIASTALFWFNCLNCYNIIASEIGEFSDAWGLKHQVASKRLNK